MKLFSMYKTFFGAEAAPEQSSDIDAQTQDNGKFNI